MEINNLKIVHIIPSLAQGGAESQLEKLVFYSKSKNVENIIISLKNEQTYLLNKIQGYGVTVICLDFSGFSIFASFFKLCKLLKSHDTPTMIIQCWMYHANLFGLLAAIFVGLSKKVVWNIRRTELPSGFTGMISKLSAKLSFITRVNIVCCADAAKKSHVAAGYNSKNMKVFYNGIDVRLFYPDKNKGDLFREQFCINKNDFVIGMVGRYAPIKGHIYLLKAFRRLLDVNKKNNTHIKLVLIGRDIESADSLQPYLTDILLQKHLIVLPERGDIYNVFPAFDLLCLPSESEGFPNVVAESMACGVPAIVTDVGDAAFIVDAPQMVVPPFNVEVLAARLLDFINFTDIEKTTLCLRARERVFNYFSVDNTWAEYSNLYNKILGNT